MTIMKPLLALGLLLLPCVANGEDCRVVEFPDHFEATCIGDAKPYSIPRAEIVGRSAAPTSGQARQQGASTPAGADPEAAGIEPARPPVPGQSPVSRRGRQGRPSSADMAAVLEARKRLIMQQRPQVNP